MKSRSTSIAFLLLLAACAPAVPIVGNGSDSQGNPVTSKYIDKVVDYQTRNLDLTIITAKGFVCSSNQNIRPLQGVYNLRLTCQNGVTGTATLSADYINRRDTVLYKLSNGERGRIVYGASILQTNQY